jgi:hypothetical protein
VELQLELLSKYYYNDHDKDNGMGKVHSTSCRGRHAGLSKKAMTKETTRKIQI